MAGGMSDEEVRQHLEEFETVRLSSLLPSCYNSSRGTNVHKLIRLLVPEKVDLWGTLGDVKAAHGVDTVEGYSARLFSSVFGVDDVAKVLSEEGREAMWKNIEAGASVLGLEKYAELLRTRMKTVGATKKDIQSLLVGVCGVDPSAITIIEEFPASFRVKIDLSNSPPQMWQMPEPDIIRLISLAKAVGVSFALEPFTTFVDDFILTDETTFLVGFASADYPNPFLVGVSQTGDSLGGFADEVEAQLVE